MIECVFVETDAEASVYKFEVYETVQAAVARELTIEVEKPFNVLNDDGTVGTITALEKQTVTRNVFETQRLLRAKHKIGSDGMTVEEARQFVLNTFYQSTSDAN